MDEIRLCKAIYDESEKDVKFESETHAHSRLEDQIEEDKKYGTMKPRNGKYFTVEVMDWKDKLITNKQILKGVTIAWHQAEIEIDIDVRLAKEDEDPDFRVYFRKTADDPELRPNTLMYHYYPINNVDNPLRGVCVVNTDWNWSIDGKPVSMHQLDPDHYAPDTAAQGETIDFDGVYGHEGPGHGLGLPHTTQKQTLMYGNYRHMMEVVSLENPQSTIPRWKAKYPVRKMLSRLRKRWRNWWKVRSENY